MRRFLLTIVLTFPMVIPIPPSTVSTVEATHGAAGHFPTSDYCGWVWRHPKPDGKRHNGLDVWTKSDGTGLSGAKGFPVQLAYPGVLKEKLFGNAKLYGLRFHHPDRDESTHYWHMADADSSTSYVENALVVGQSYPAGTFLGFQGNFTPGSTDRTTHLHATLTTGDTPDDGYVPGEHPFSATSYSKDPTTFFGRNLNYDSAGQCYFGAQPTDNSIHYRGPLPESDHPYPNNFQRWYTVVNWDVNATVTTLEFCTLSLEFNWDFLDVRNFNLQILETFTGSFATPRLSGPHSGRVFLIELRTDGSVQMDGFTICNYHSS